MEAKKKTPDLSLKQIIQKKLDEKRSHTVERGAEERHKRRENRKMDFVRYIKKRGHRDPSSRAGSTTYRARLKPKKIDDISLDAIEQGNQQDNQMGGGLVGTIEERDEAERERLASPRSAVNSSSGVAAANFADRHLTHFDESRYDKPQYIIDRERAMAAANQTLKERNVHTPLISHLGEPVVYKRTPIPENTEILNDFYEKPPKPTKPPIKDDYIKVKKPEEIDICENIPLGGHYAWQNCCMGFIKKLP